MNNMGGSLRVALPGYNALTDTNPDHFALYSDEDWILIKEKLRGTLTFTGTETQTIAHGLGYVPVCFVYYEKSSGVWAMPRMATAADAVPVYVEIDDTNLYVSSNSWSGNVKYYIFYDQQI